MPAAAYQVCFSRFLEARLPYEHGSLQKGDKVEYRPVGGAGENVSHTHGVIENVFQTEDGVSVLANRRVAIFHEPSSYAANSVHHQERQHGEDHQLPGALTVTFL